LLIISNAAGLLLVEIIERLHGGAPQAVAAVQPTHTATAD